MCQVPQSHRTHTQCAAKGKQHNAAKPSTETDRPLAPLSWAERLKRVFKLDIEVCPKCGGRLCVIAAITEPNAIQKILDHVHQQQAPPRQPQPGIRTHHH